MASSLASSIDRGSQDQAPAHNTQPNDNREEKKMEIRMALGGKAWRGYFPVGDELTSGKPDLKEGLYFGTELGEEDARVQADLPMHGANLFPTQITFTEQTHQ